MDVLCKEDDHSHIGNSGGTQTYGYENIPATVKTALEASLGLYSLVVRPFYQQA